MDARQFFEVAEELVATAEADPAARLSAGRCRSASSRAYYAAYLAVRDLLDSFGIDVARIPNPHANLQQALQNCGVFTLQRVGVQLRELCADRTTADYNLRASEPDSPDKARSSVELARLVLQTIQIVRAGRFSPPIDPEAVVTAVLDWARANSKPIYRKPT
jgi:uncharacterized protein (UPF0332 family)